MGSERRTYTREEIQREYDTAAESQAEYEKVKWGSQEKMLQRFALALELLPFANAEKWLDVGCGTGAFQAAVLKKYPQVCATAIDISPELLQFSSARYDTRGAIFRLLDFMEVSDNEFDIITAIGVLQKTTFGVHVFFQKAWQLLRAGGILFLDTKNAGWNEFTSGRLLPEQDHEWFKTEELQQAAIDAGFHVECLQGFLPGEGAIVKPEQSHTVFMIARKAGGK